MAATGLRRASGPAARKDVAPLAVRVLAAAVAVFTVAGVALILAADRAVGWSGYESADVAVFLLTFPVLPVTGALLAARRPGNAIGWLFLSAALGIAISAFAHGYGDYALDARPGSLPAAAFVTWWGWTGFVGFALLAVFVPLVFPTGRLPSARWRPVAVLGAAATAAVTLAVALKPGHLVDFHSARNPLGIGGLGGFLDALESVAAPLVLVALVGALASLVVRYRAGDPVSRRQLQWLAWAAGVLVVVDVVGNLALGGALDDHPAYCTWGTAATKPIYGTVVPALLYAGLPVAVAVAVLRHNLYDLDRLIRRSAVYATLWAAIALAYTAVAWALGVAVTGRLPVAVGVLVTIVATLVFQPARRRLERVADRWVFGHRPSGYSLAAGFGATLGAPGDLDDLAASLAEIVRRGLDVEWATVDLDGAGAGPAVTVTARSGTPGERGAPHLTVPVSHLDNRVGEIRCGPPRDARRRPENPELLDLLAHEAALAVHNISLARSLGEQMRTVDAQAVELAASRARIVSAQEAERRRVERDIHDGAQQDLVAMIAKLRIARELVVRDPADAVATLEDLQRDARAALVGIRELAQGIHPSVLGDEGLVAAISSRAARLPLDVSVHADEATRAHRATDAVEGGAFFVASEALANVLKHAEATSATVSIEIAAGVLTLDVCDDGRGFDPAAAGGDGLTRLADRVGGLGGELRVRSAPGAGTTLTARFPVPEADLVGVDGN